MIKSSDEWSPLRDVVVGIADYANWPSTDPVFALESQKTTWKETPVPRGAVPQWIIDEANQDLDQLSNTLTMLGVNVQRPSAMNFQSLDGMYNYCPRDRFIIAGDTVVDCNMMYPCREMENRAYMKVFADRPRTIYMPRNRDTVADAANVCRLGDDWLYLLSASGNRGAYEWLCEQFPEKNIELCHFYSGVHIDSTIVPIREGLVLVNGGRVNAQNLPRVFADWQVEYVTESQITPQTFHEYPYASNWIALNMLMVNPELAIVDADQTQLIALLNRLGVTVIPLKLRHSRTLGGGFHCVTLDLVRG